MVVMISHKMEVWEDIEVSMMIWNWISNGEIGHQNISQGWCFNSFLAILILNITISLLGSMVIYVKVTGDLVKFRRIGWKIGQRSMVIWIEVNGDLDQAVDQAIRN